MSRDIYLRGVFVGKKLVMKYLSSVKEASTSEDLGRLAGRALLELLSNEKAIERYELARTASWREGLWDGFFDRAKEIKDQENCQSQSD